MIWQWPWQCDSYNSTTTIQGVPGEDREQTNIIMNPIEIKKWIIIRRRKQRQQNIDDTKAEGGGNGNGDGQKL